MRPSVPHQQHQHPLNPPAHTAQPHHELSRIWRASSGSFGAMVTRLGLTVDDLISSASPAKYALAASSTSEEAGTPFRGSISKRSTMFSKKTACVDGGGNVGAVERGTGPAADGGFVVDDADSDGLEGSDGVEEFVEVLIDVA